jgi:hypothetical protein
MKNPIKLNITYLAALAIATVMTSSCGYKSFSMSGPLNAVVLAFTGVDSSGKAEFALTEKTFRTMTGFNNLDGTYLNIKRGGTLTIKNLNGSIVESPNFEGGEAPGLRYEVKGGAAIALDYSTLAMLSAYYQLDEIYSTIEEKTGVTPAALQANLPGGKHIMFFEPVIKFSGKGTDISAGIKLNAAFSPSDKKFLLFQRSPIESVPLSGNFQVMTHEFGHFMFDYSFYAGKFNENNRWSKEWAISGINEGFADFMSWTFTDSTDILRSSIDIAKIADERDFAKTTFTFSDLQGDDPTACKGEFYCVGSLFARSLYQTQKALASTVTKKAMSNGVIETLKKCQAAMDAMDPTHMPAEKDREPMNAITRFDYDGAVTSGFIEAFIKNAPAAWKSELCNAFENNFGSTGFNSVARTAACG